MILFFFCISCKFICFLLNFFYILTSFYSVKPYEKTSNDFKNGSFKKTPINRRAVVLKQEIFFNVVFAKQFKK